MCWLFKLCCIKGDVAIYIYICKYVNACTFKQAIQSLIQTFLRWFLCLRSRPSHGKDLSGSQTLDTLCVVSLSGKCLEIKPCVWKWNPVSGKLKFSRCFPDSSFARSAWCIEHKQCWGLKNYCTATSTRGMGMVRWSYAKPHRRLSLPPVYTTCWTSQATRPDLTASSWISLES